MGGELNFGMMCGARILKAPVSPPFFFYGLLGLRMPCGFFFGLRNFQLLGVVERGVLCNLGGDEAWGLFGWCYDI